MTYASDFGAAITGALRASLGNIAGFDLLTALVIVGFSVFLAVRGASLEAFALIMIPLLWLLQSTFMLPVWVWAIILIAVGISFVFVLYRVMER